MYQEKRPTCVTVIGWAWIIIGGLMLFSAIMALFGSAMISEMSRAHPEAQEHMPAIFRFFPLLAIIQSVVAVVGLVSGISFLKLKPWSRNVLEILAWLLMLFVVGFGIYWEAGWLSMTSKHGPRGFDVMGAVMGGVIIGIYGVSLGIMLKYLRGDKVKNAMTGTADSL
jgi:cation transport ATPase